MLVASWESGGHQLKRGSTVTKWSNRQDESLYPEDIPRLNPASSFILLMMASMISLKISFYLEIIQKLYNSCRSNKAFLHILHLDKETSIFFLNYFRVHGKYNGPLCPKIQYAFPNYKGILLSNHCTLIKFRKFSTSIIVWFIIQPILKFYILL